MAKASPLPFCKSSEEHEYEVHFTITKTVKVKALDDISAEIAAAKLLSPHERSKVRTLEVCDITEPDTTGEVKPDREWWTEPYRCDALRQ